MEKEGRKESSFCSGSRSKNGLHYMAFDMSMLLNCLVFKNIIIVIIRMVFIFEAIFICRSFLKSCLYTFQLFNIYSLPSSAIESFIVSPHKMRFCLLASANSTKSIAQRKHFVNHFFQNLLKFFYLCFNELILYNNK